MVPDDGGKRSAGLAIIAQSDVGATAGFIIGAIARVPCLAVELFERLQINDPVGAIWVHGVCGLWRVLAGLFLDSVVGRVSPEVVEGLDVSETGVLAYPEFSLLDRRGTLVDRPDVLGSGEPA